MIPYENMPEDREALAKLDVELPSLNAEETARHPEFMDELMEYLEMEADADLSGDDLTFVRSAQVAEQRYWIWEFVDDSLEKCYATVAESPKGGKCVGYDTAEGLTPEQFMLATYHECL